MLNHVIFADPSNMDARNLAADALEQLGYQSENHTWRNAYLVGAMELRRDVPKSEAVTVASTDTLNALPSEMLLDYMGILLKTEKARDKRSKIVWVQPDTREKFALELRDGILVYTKDKELENPDATLIMTRAELAQAIMGAGGPALADGAKGKVSGDPAPVRELLGLFDEFNADFPIVMPRSGSFERRGAREYVWVCPSVLWRDARAP